MAKSEIVSRILYLVYRVRDWVQKNRLEAFVLAIVLLVGAFFRLYKIDQYMTFLGDEGRDALVVRRLLVDFDPILVGPGTSIGNMYLGPLYYYMMAPALLLAYFSPVGPAVMIALLGVATVFFVWYIARELFPVSNVQGRSLHVGALVASALYAISPTVIIYSRSSWNPNIMPIFSLLTIYSVWQFWEKQKFKWLIVSGISMAFVLQSHYLGLLLAPVIGISWLLTLIKVKGERQEVKELIKNTIYGGLVFLLLMSPLVIFDARHNWRNFEAIKIFFTQRQTTVSARPWTALPKIPEIMNKVVVRLVTGTNELKGKFASYVILISIPILSVLLLYNTRTNGSLGKRKLNALFLLLIWMIVFFIGLGVYKQEIYDHYYGVIFSAPFLLIGALIQEVSALGRKRISFPIFFGISIILYFLISVNLHNNPLRYPPNRQLQRSIEVSEKIMNEAGNEKFNLAVIAERNYEGAYQYYLERWNSPIIIIDPQRYEETVTDQLFVVCELSIEKCDPLNHPKAEIANFGWKKIDNTWEVSGVLLYKLGHTQ